MQAPGTIDRFEGRADMEDAKARIEWDDVDERLEKAEAVIAA